MAKNAFHENVRLAWDLAQRDLNAKYRRSALSGLWLILTPLCLLGIYYLVFGIIFKVSWQMPLPDGSSQSLGFALPFFVGLSVYLALSDIVNSSSVLFASKRTYVVKSPFPLWVLWLSNLMRAGVHAGASLVLVIILALVQQRLTFIGIGWMLVGLICCIIFMAGVSLILAALGPFIGDISEVTRLLLRVMFYATPISYPIEMLPEPYRSWMWFNPLADMVEILRHAIVYGTAPPYMVLGIFFVCALLFYALSHWVFMRVKKVVADVV